MANQETAFDKATLPSGRIVALTPRADQNRPWGALDIGGGRYVVTRTRRGDSSVVEYYKSTQREPLQFGQDDIDEIVRILNGLESRRHSPGVSRSGAEEAGLQAPARKSR